MQNVGKKFLKVDSGLSGRDAELWNDFLSIFHGTSFETQAKGTSEFYLAQRRDSIKESLEAKIFRILKPLLDESLEIESTKIWKDVTNSDELPGKLDEHTGRTFYLDEDDRKLTPNTVADIVRFKFQAKKKTVYEKVEKTENTRSGRRKITLYIFDEEIVKFLSEKYHINDL